MISYNFLNALSQLTTFSMTYCNWLLLYALLQKIVPLILFQFTTFIWTIGYNNFWFHCCKWKNCMQQWHLQLFPVLWQLLIYIGTIAINYFSMPYFNSQLLYESLLFTAFVCTIVNSKLFMHYYNSRHLLYVLLQLKMLLQQYCNWQLFIHYHDYWLLYALLQLTNLVCTVVIDNLFMHYCNWQLLYAI